MSACAYYTRPPTSFKTTVDGARVLMNDDESPRACKSQGLPLAKTSVEGCDVLEYLPGGMTEDEILAD